MSAFAGTGKPNWARVPLQIIQNPIIIGCAIGWVVNTLSVSVPDWVMTSLSILDRGTLPLALLCVGAGLILVMDRTQVLAMSASVVLKLAVMPVIAIVLCQYFGVTGIPMAIVVLFAGAPASTSSYILARQMGGNAPLMAAILSVQTILAAVTLPPILAYVAP
jgi:malonate transporter